VEKGAGRMSDWVHNLPFGWMAALVFGLSYVGAGMIHALVARLAVGERGRAFKAVSPGMLPPLGIIFGLFVAFTAAQVWSDIDRANAAVSREASSLRAAVILSSTFPGEPEARLRGLIRQYVQEAVDQEWPMMASQAADLRTTARALAEALRFTLALAPTNNGQQTAQRELVTALENAADARRQRILVSRSEVHAVKWLCLILQAVCALVATAMVHSDNRLASAVTLAMFATGVAASILLIASHDRPFTGDISVGPDPLVQVMPADPEK